MRTAVFSSQGLEEAIYTEVNKNFGHDICYLKESLCEETATAVSGVTTVCVTARDNLHKNVLEILAAGGTRNIVMRSFDLGSIDLSCAKHLGMQIVELPPVPALIYAEYIVAVLLFLLRGLGRVQEEMANVRTTPGSSVSDKRVLLVGDDGVVNEVEHMLTGFSCSIDLLNPAHYLSPEDVISELTQRLPNFDVVIVHSTYRKQTVGMFSERVVKSLKPGALFLSTGWTEFIDFVAISKALDKGLISALGLDVRENGFFMHQIETKPYLQHLLDQSNVFISVDQAPFTIQSVEVMAENVFRVLSELEHSGDSSSEDPLEI